MLSRLLKLPKKQHLLIFGARGTGKSTLLKNMFQPKEVLWLNLLNLRIEAELARDPEMLAAMVEGTTATQKYIIIDEIQKLPKLLDVVHRLIEEVPRKYFILTGSSARKLKQGSANLLAGRALMYELFPFSFMEIGEKFDLDDALATGLLPKVYLQKSATLRHKILQTYTLTYLKEEIWAEQLVKNLDPFRKFLEVAAQMNGKIINYAAIAKDVGVTEKTVAQYFSILEDTLLGFLLEPYHTSLRKQLSQKPKFYYFDVGVTRALARVLRLPLQPSTSAYGEAFEHFIIVECIKLANYRQNEYKFSYLRTKDDIEIDLIVERPGRPLLLIEIKSSFGVNADQLTRFSKISKEFKNAEVVCFSQDTLTKKIGHIKVYPWREGIKKYFN